LGGSGLRKSLPNRETAEGEEVYPKKGSHQLADANVKVDDVRETFSKIFGGNARASAEEGTECRKTRPLEKGRGPFLLGAMSEDGNAR